MFERCTVGDFEFFQDMVTIYQALIVNVSQRHYMEWSKKKAEKKDEKRLVSSGIRTRDLKISSKKLIYIDALTHYSIADLY